MALTTNSNGLLPGLGGTGYTNTQPINFGSISTAPKTTSPLPSPTMVSSLSTKYPAATPSMGVTAANPAANIKPPNTVLPSSHINGTQPAPQPQYNSGNSTPAPTYNNTAPTGGYTPNTGLFGQLVSGLANTSSQGSPAAPGLISQLVSASQTNSLQNSGAYDAYAKAVQNLAALKSGMAQQFGSIESQPIPLEFQQGREQVLQRQYASQLDAAQGAVNQAQQALGYGIQEQQAQQSGLGTALSQALSAQGQQQTGLNQAAGLAQPQFPSYTSAQFSPTTGQYATVGGGQFGSGPAAAANVQSIQDQTSSINTLSGARQMASNLSNQLSSFLQQNNVNPSDFNAVNKFVQSIAANTSSTQYQQLSNLVNDLASAYAQVLTPPGGNQTDMVRQIAQSLINASASGQSIIQVIQGLDNQAQTKIQGLQQNVQNIQSGNNPNPSSYGSQPKGWL